MRFYNETTLYVPYGPLLTKGYYIFIFIALFVFSTHASANDVKYWVQKNSEQGDSLWLFDGITENTFHNYSVAGQKLAIYRGNVYFSSGELISLSGDGEMHCKYTSIPASAIITTAENSGSLFIVSIEAIYSIQRQCNYEILYEYHTKSISNAIYGYNDAFAFIDWDSHVYLAENGEVKIIPLSDSYNPYYIGGEIQDRILINGYYGSYYTGGDEEGSLLSIDKEGNVYWEINEVSFSLIEKSGEFYAIKDNSTDTHGTKTITVIKYDKDANLLCEYSQLLHPYDDGNQYYAQPLAFDDEENVYYYDYGNRLEKYNKQCEMIWSTEISVGEVGMQYSRMKKSNDYLLFFGSDWDGKEGSRMNHSVDIAVFDLEGEYLWHENDFMIEGAANTEIADVVADEDGNIYSAGYYIMDDEENETVGGCGC